MLSPAFIARLLAYSATVVVVLLALLFLGYAFHYAIRRIGKHSLERLDQALDEYFDSWMGDN